METNNTSLETAYKNLASAIDSSKKAANFAQLQTAFITYAESAKVPNARKLVADAVLAITQNPALLECTPATLLGVFMATATLGLSLNPIIGLAYLIPRGRKVNDGWIKQATLQISYKGYLQLLYRANPDFIVDCDAICKGEKCTIEKGSTTVIKHELNINREATYENIVGAYGVVKNRHTGQHLATVYLAKAELEKMRMANPDQKNDKQPVGAWTWYKSMSLAKVCRQICKNLAMNEASVDESIIELEPSGQMEITPEYDAAKEDVLLQWLEELDKLAETCNNTDTATLYINNYKNQYLELFDNWDASSIRARCVAFYRQVQGKEKANTIKIS